MSTIDNPYRKLDEWVGDDPAVAYEEGFKAGREYASKATAAAFEELVRVREILHLTTMRMLSVIQPDRTGQVLMSSVGKSELERQQEHAAKAFELVAILARVDDEQSGASCVIDLVKAARSLMGERG